MNIQKIPNQIIKEPLQSLNLAKVDSIALHHMDSNTADVKEVERWHINQGWRAIGYHFWVAFDGTIYEGRGFCMGAGVENQNDHIISIGFQGDYHSTPITMSDAQFNAGIDIVSYVKSEVPSIIFVGGHKDFMATACPGQYFPLAEMQTGKRREDIPSIKDCTNELLWRGIITNQTLWDLKAQADEDLRWLFAKYYPYLLKNGGSVKGQDLSSDAALAVLQKQKIVTDYEKWNQKAYEDPDIYSLLIKMSDYIN